MTARKARALEKVVKSVEETHRQCGGAIEHVESYGGDILARQCRRCREVIDARCPGCGVFTTRLPPHIEALCKGKPAARRLLEVFGDVRAR